MSNQNPTIENRKARYDYFVEDTLECGISLWGNEVKSIRDGKCNITQAWVTVQNGRVVLRGMHISPWGTANTYDIDENRERALLAHKKEIRKLAGKASADGYTLIPLKVYFTDNGKCKVLVGLCRGKKNYDKRETVKQRDIERDIRRKR